MTWLAGTMGLGGHRGLACWARFIWSCNLFQRCGRFFRPLLSYPTLRSGRNFLAGSPGRAVKFSGLVTSTNFIMFSFCHQWLTIRQINNQLHTFYKKQTKKWVSSRFTWWVAGLVWRRQAFPWHLQQLLSRHWMAIYTKMARNHE